MLQIIERKKYVLLSTWINVEGGQYSYSPLYLSIFKSSLDSFFLSPFSPSLSSIPSFLLSFFFFSSCRKFLILYSIHIKLALHFGVVKQEMARVNVDILGISELKWTGMGEFNSDDHYIYYCGQESLRRNGVAIMVNKRVRNAVLGCNLKNNRMISVHFQGKPFNITVIQVYAPTSNAEEVEWFFEDLQDLLELTPKKDVLSL